MEKEIILYYDCHYELWGSNITTIKFIEKDEQNMYVIAHEIKLLIKWFTTITFLTRDYFIILVLVIYFNNIVGYHDSQK